MKKQVFVLSTFIVATFAGLATGASAYTTERFTPEANKASYWGESCTKYDNFGGKTYKYTADNQSVTKVIIKAGTQNTIYTEKFTDIGASDGKAISHVIVCTGEVVETPAAPVVDKPETPKNDTPKNDTPKEQKPKKDMPNQNPGNKDKEDKNQSACNPSDYRSANLKHRDDGDKCKTEAKKDNQKPTTPAKDVEFEPGKGGGTEQKEDVAKEDNNGKGGPVDLPSELPRTGTGAIGLIAGVLTSLATYGAFLRKR